MHARHLALALLAAGWLGLSSTSADERVTVMMRDGTLVSGPLEAMHSGSVWVRERPDQQRTLRQSDVALLDFVGGGSGLPATETREAGGPQHLLVLRNGESRKGRLVKVSGGEGDEGVNSKLTFVFRADRGANEEFSTGQIGRLYLGRFPNAAPRPDPRKPGGAR
jgi:hypothetical protein